MGEKASKFLFNNRDFSDQAMEAEIKAKKNAPPPPPTFSESQLETAKKKAFQEGFNNAVEHEKASREAHLSRMFDEIARQMDILITSETVRSARFEKESIQVALSMMTQIYPILNAHCAENQLLLDLTNILEKNRDQDSILLKVHPEMMDVVQNRLSALESLTIKSDPSLGISDAGLSWPNGGIEINREAMMNDLETVITELLYGKETPEINNPELMSDTQALDKQQVNMKRDEAAIKNDHNKEMLDQS